MRTVCEMPWFMPVVAFTVLVVRAGAPRHLPISVTHTYTIAAHGRTPLVHHTISYGTAPVVAAMKQAGGIISAGGSPWGIGSDVGGSIRIPAFFNGIFGHKPSAGIVNNSGHVPRARGIINDVYLGPWLPRNNNGVM